MRNRELKKRRNRVNKDWRRAKEDDELIAIKDENRDGYIVLKQESLYKPLLIVFGIQIFVMAIIFPNIFDSLWPEGMTQIRNIISWMALSASGTLLPIPGLSPSDYRFIPMIISTDVSNMVLLFTGALIVASDTLFAFFGYKFTNTLRKLFMSRRKEKDEAKVNDRFKKYGNIAMFVGAATPLPFTLMVYTAGALKLKRNEFLVAVFFGRAIKYAMLAVPIRLFNFDIMAYGETLLADFLAGNLNAMHFVVIGLILILLVWLGTSIFKTVKESKLVQNRKFRKS